MRSERLVVSLVAGVVGLAAGTGHGVTVDLPATADARILAISGAEGTSRWLSTYFDGGNVQYSVLYFDLPVVPAGDVVSSATLTLWSITGFGYNPNGRAMDVFRLTRPWVESEVWWQRASAGQAWTQPGAKADAVGLDGKLASDPTATPYARSTAAGGPANQTPVTWDVTSLVNAWRSGAPNHGMLLVSQEGNGLHFYAREEAGTTLDPVLTMTYGKLAGDANLNGTIDADDFALTDRGRAMGLSGWGNGDFNGDNEVDGADYVMLDGSWRQQVGAGISAFAAVPEPATGLVGMVIAVVGGLGRRRERR